MIDGQCATKLFDTALLAKLAVSDMHAFNVQYHRNCLIALDNLMCSKQSNCQGGNTNSVSVKV